MNKHDIQVGDYVLKEDLVRDFETYQAVVKAFEDAGFPLHKRYPDDIKESYERMKRTRYDVNIIYIALAYDVKEFIGSDLSRHSFANKRNVEEFLPTPYKPDEDTVCEFSLNEQDWFSCRVKMYARDTKDNPHGVLLRTFLGEKHEQDQYFDLEEVSFRESQDPHLKLATLGYRFSERCAIIKTLGVGVND